MKRELVAVMRYLRGEIDLYNGHYEKAIQVWYSVWTEMKYLGYNPEKADDIKKYIVNEL